MLKKKIILRPQSFLLTCMLALLGSTSVSADPANPWKIEVAPYLWAMNMNGRVQVGSQSAHVTESFSDIMKQFKGGGMLWIDANKDRLGLFFNGMYSVLSNTTDAGPFEVDSTNKFGIFSAGVSYEVFQKTLANAGQIAIEPYLGARYTLNNTTLKVSGTGISATDNQHWTDPIIGARVRYNISKAWLALVAGDVGGTNFNNHNSYNINAFVGYKPQTMLKNTTFYLGYRLLYQNYVSGSGANRFSWDMKLFGPVAGFSMAL